MDALTLTITPTDRLTTLDGVPCRVWDGVAADGTRCLVFVRLVAVPDGAGQDQAAFERRLVELLPPAVEVDVRDVLILGLAGRVAAQSEILSRRAGRPHN